MTLGISEAIILDNYAIVNDFNVIEIDVQTYTCSNFSISYGLSDIELEDGTEGHKLSLVVGVEDGWEFKGIQEWVPALITHYPDGFSSQYDITRIVYVSQRNYPKFCKGEAYVTLRQGQLVSAKTLSQLQRKLKWCDKLDELHWDDTLENKIQAFKDYPVTRQIALDAGCCEIGTDQFIERYALGGKRSIKLSKLAEYMKDFHYSNNYLAWIVGHITQSLYDWVD